MNRRVGAAAAVLALVVWLVGCAPDIREQLDSINAELRSAAMSVDGVTGGSIGIGEGSVGQLELGCRLVGSGSDRAQLSASLDEVLEIAADYVQPFDDGTVSCQIENATHTAGSVMTDLGFSRDAYVSFDELREHYR